MVKRKSQLQDEINKCNIFLDNDKKYRNIDLIKILGNHYRERINTSFGQLRLMELESLMLCARFNELKPDAQYELFNSEDWIAEPKHNGVRMVIAYNPDEGFSFVSRHISEENFLPIDYTDKVLLKTPDKSFKQGKDFIGTFKFSFILDCEVIAQGMVDTTLFSKYGTVTESQLNSTAVILNINTETSHILQKEQAPLKFISFDMIYIKDKWILDTTLQERKSIQEQITSFLSSYFWIENSKVFILPQDKQREWEYQLNNRGEGLVFKNLHKPYYPFEARQKDIQVKLKRDMSITAKRVEVEDIDAFIIGAEAGQKNTAFENLIGSVKFGVYLEDDEIHHVATVSGLNLELRKSMTVINKKGKPQLNEEFLHKVCVINGHTVSPKSLRFAHATCDFKFREDKTQYDCKLIRSFLRDNII